MPLSPEEIKSRDFLVALRGYDKIEVETFLQEVANQQAELMADLALAHGGNLSEPLTGADPFADLGEQVASVMRAAADAATQLQTEAEREAASIRVTALDEASRAAAEARLELEAASELRTDAEREAAQIRADARAEVDRLRNEARQMLEQAKEARLAADRDATEQRESTNRQRQELHAQAEETVAKLLASAKEEVEEAVRQVLQGCEGLKRVEQRHDEGGVAS